MENGKLNVLHYDRCDSGCVRLLKNSRLIKEAAEGKLELNLKDVDRAKKFGNQPNASDLLVQEEGFLFDAVIINTAGKNSDDVLEDAVFGLEYHGLPLNRIIYLHQGDYSNDLVEQGIRVVKVHGGNSYLTPKNSEQVVQALQGLVPK